MGTAPVLNTIEEYFQIDERSEVPGEFHDGEIFPIEDTTLCHQILAGNLATLLNNRLAGGKCRVAATAYHRATARNILKPDVSVFCGAPVYASDKRSITNPSLVIEVLSPSTQDYDYGGKFRLYRQMETLQEYALVSQERVQVEIFRKTATGEWLLSSYAGTETAIRFQSVGVEIPLSAIYAGTDDLGAS
jgi:Uma2 family endonuclease